jgi:hypothetical protein
VQKAGPVFTGRMTGGRDGQGFRVTMELDPFAFNNNDTGKRVIKTLGGYIQAHIRSQGWRVKSVSFRRGYLEMFFAPASSSASSRSKNRSARV